MSDFIDMMVEMLPVNSQLQKKDNPVHVVLDRSVGAYMDTFEIPYEQIFLTTATGGWLDAHGKDYGIPRRLNEDDEHYRQRIIYEKLDHLTPSLLSDVYNVRLFTYRRDFDIPSNTLVSDNPHIVQSNSFLGVSDEDTIRILDKKFILDNVVTWINEDGSIDYIFDSRGINILSEYSKVYTLSNLNNYFKNNDSFEKVKLNLPSAIICEYTFTNCLNLSDIDLILPNATDCYSMLFGCSDLINATLTLPKATNVAGLFVNCTRLENIKLNLQVASDCRALFVSCTNLISVDLNLPSATACESMFTHCQSINDIDLTLPNVSNAKEMFWDCPNLINVKLNLPKVSNYHNMFNYSENIETIDVTIPTNQVNGFKTMVEGATPRLTKLTSFKINGEEQL